MNFPPHSTYDIRVMFAKSRKHVVRIIPYTLDSFAKPIRRIDRFMTNVLQVQRVADTINCENVAGIHTDGLTANARLHVRVVLSLRVSHTSCSHARDEHVHYAPCQYVLYTCMSY